MLRSGCALPFSLFKTQDELTAPRYSTDYELSTYFSHIDFLAIPAPTIDLTRLVNDEEGWSELGKQLAPLQLSTLSLYRTFINASDGEQLRSCPSRCGVDLLVP